ncbi:MAG: helix-turn-helix transcriptional regulator, partial [Clostridia bacterium]|nr:helix-turn-helix transcriptional regulator [Clostridia bacterium]
MLNENLKRLRAEKGYTQETLAAKLHVVRQTVSKWEKGLSVPDAEMLVCIADTLEVSVNELLGAQLPQEENQRNEIAEQLSRINEQLVVKNRRARRFWKGLGIAAGALVLGFVLTVAAMVTLRARVRADHAPAGEISWNCTLEGVSMGWGVTFDRNYQVVEAGGDEWIADHVDFTNCRYMHQVQARL